MIARPGTGPPGSPSSLAARVLGLASRGRPRTIATAESCTGGLLAAALTEIPGSSRCFLGGVVAYADRVKALQLGVDPDLLRRWGAVSRPVAVAMAQGVRRSLGSDVGISTTGVAGPGASEGKPAGLVFVAAASGELVLVRRLRADRGRQVNRQRAVEVALRLALQLLAPESPGSGAGAV